MIDIINKINYIIGERHDKSKKDKKKDKDKHKNLGVTSAPSRMAQKTYVGMGSIKDLMKKEDLCMKYLNFDFDLYEVYVDKSAKYKEKYKDFKFDVKKSKSKSKKTRGHFFGGDTGKDADYKRTKKAPGETK